MTYQERTGQFGGKVKGWEHNEVTFELHSGQPHVLPKHSHSTYQIGTTTRDPGEYMCEGKTWYGRPGSMMLFHPGQIHSAPKAAVRSSRAVSKIMFVEPAKMRAVASDLNGGREIEPRFDDLVVLDPFCIAQFCHLHRLVAVNAPALQIESGLIALLCRLIAQFGANTRANDEPTYSRAKIESVRDYIETNYSESLTLARLAEVAHISPCHLNRVFSLEIGMPPHAFQTQIRIERSKRLLLQGMSATEAALHTGFFDQSHFTRHFRRIVGVPPRSYLRSSQSGR